jgi:hypothetical protein
MRSTRRPADVKFVYRRISSTFFKSQQIRRNICCVRFGGRRVEDIPLLASLSLNLGSLVFARLILTISLLPFSGTGANGCLK